MLTSWQAIDVKDGDHDDEDDDDAHGMFRSILQLKCLPSLSA